uniref:DNA methyltransferase n=1 Tax=Natronospira elongata TaxID=3110268 RepID=UPI0031F9B654
MAEDLQREFAQLSKRRAFGLNFERHVPETVELPGRPVRRGDKVRFLAERGEPAGSVDRRLWRVVRVRSQGKHRVAELARRDSAEAEIEKATRAVDNLVVVAEFRDPIYPGFKSTGRVERGGDKPFHTVINSENYHALQALLYTHEGKLDAIYIDPPYNSGARDWKYNNDYVDGDDSYRHSKWLAMMERRLKLARRLLNPDDSVLIVTIDEKEVLRLGLLLEQIFSECRIQMISTQINPAAVARAGQFGRSDEYLFFIFVGDACPQRQPLSREWVSAKGRTHTGKPRWDMLRRSGTNAERAHSPKCFYPIYIDPNGPKVHSVGQPLERGCHEAPPVEGVVPVLPIRQDGSEGNWQWAPETFRKRLSQGRVRISGNAKRGYVVSILKDGEYRKIQEGDFIVTGRGPDGSMIAEAKQSNRIVAIPGTQWRIGSHDSTQYGSRLLSKVLTDRRFPFPKSLYAVEDALRFFVSNKPQAVILDFFSGSGTTAHAILRLNRQDDGRRQCISVTNNEVSADEQKLLRERGLRPGDPKWEALGICEYITKPRIQAAITGKTPEGQPIKGDYKFTDEFPMADGFEENVEFFDLTYHAPRPVAHHREFAAIAPLLWMKAGAEGRRIDKPCDEFDVADTYGVLFDLDAMHGFIEMIKQTDSVRMAFVITDDDRGFQSVCGELPARVEAVRLYESYLSNFVINAGRE